MVADAAYFDDATTTVTSGTFLSGERPGIVLSMDNARLLGVSVGDEMGLFVEAARGVPLRRNLPVTGLFESGHAGIDGTTFFVRHEEAQSLDEPQRAAAFVDLHREVFDRLGVEASTWREIHGSLIVFVEISGLLTAVSNAFVMIVAASIVANAILMTVFDRAQIFARLRAIGMRRTRLVGTILWEGVLLGAAGSALGLAVGIPIVLYFQAHGLHMGELSQFFGTGQTYYFAFKPGSSVAAFGFGVLIAVMSALYAGIAVGTAIMIVSVAWVRGCFTSLFGGIIRIDTGHAQVLHEEYRSQERRLPPDLTVNGYESVRDRLLELPSVMAVSARLDFGAQIAHVERSDRSMRLLGRGIEPEYEEQITVIWDHIVDGYPLSLERPGLRSNHMSAGSMRR